MVCNVEQFTGIINVVTLKYKIHPSYYTTDGKVVTVSSQTEQ